MLKNIPDYLKLFLAIGIIYSLPLLYSENKTLPDNSQEGLIKDEPEIQTYKKSEKKRNFADDLYRYYSESFTDSAESLPSFLYHKRDWNRYIIMPSYFYLKNKKKLFQIYSGDDLRINSYGSMKLNLKYGKSFFTHDKYRQYDDDKPVSRVIDSGFLPAHEMQLHIEGDIGNRMTIYIDHDSRKKDNRYRMQYRAAGEEELIREINAGEIDIKFNKSKYAVFDNNTAKGQGIDFTLKKNDFQIKAFGSITRGNTEVEYFKGKSSPGDNNLSEYQYIKRTYYQLEPFKRYDNLNTVPSGASSYSDLVTFTSSPSNPDTYRLSQVNIDPAGFELYMDDQNPYNNYNAIVISIDNGRYTKLVSGRDYTINFITGLIEFKIRIPEKARIFAVYNLKSGQTSDPGVLTEYDSAYPADHFSGKLFVFIKYGYSMNEDSNRNMQLDIQEDANNDGKMNLDIYEVRSCYFIGDKQILPDNFSIKFTADSREFTSSQLSSIGKYSVDYTGGLIKFIYREPFKALLSAEYSSTSASIIYSEKQNDNVFLDSHYKLKFDYYREARSFQLKHFNIIPDSVSVRINTKRISKSLFSVDYTSGFFMFTDPNNPMIGPDTDIEIKYEYIPFASQNQSFIGGLRGDYKLNRDLSIGGSLLFNRSASGKIIPQTGDSPEQTILFEGDASLHLGKRRLADFVNIFTDNKKETIPVEIDAYAEYAKSHRNINTFGKALIDNMESNDEIISISLSEKDWILSSMPSGYGQNDRGLLYYFYYKDPSNPGSLQGPSFNAAEINYSEKPGPYNIATGHISGSIEKETSQRSLVLDFDMSGGSAVSIVTRKLSENSVDFSGLQYVEIWYKYESAAQSILSIDIGKINEDSDGDGILDTEDVNNNGFIDSDPGSGYSEDRGYSFDGNNSTWIGSGPGLNSITAGNGKLNTEDLNGNGILDTFESIYPLPSVTLNAGDSGWKSERIYIDQTSLTQTDINVLKLVESIRLNISNTSGSRGKLYIDSIRFVSSRFREPQLNGAATGPDNLSITMINSINDSEYRSEAFLFQEESVYTSLYGEKSSDELSREKETALQIEYNLTGGGNVSFTRKFSKPLDLRFYKTMNLWFNFRNYSGGEIIGILIGSSEKDFIEYRFPIEHKGSWREIKLKLNKGSKGDVDIYSASGNPDMKRVRIFKVFVYGAPGNSGKIWMNDFYVSEPETLAAEAHWFEVALKVDEPLYRTESGIPILSDINIKYIQKGHTSQFSSIGRKESDISEKYKQVLSRVRIIPGWDTSLDFVSEKSETDSLNEDVDDLKRGAVKRNSIYIVSNYSSDIEAVPGIKIAYRRNRYSRDRDESMSGYRIITRTEERTHSPVISIEEEINDFLYGRLFTKIFIDMFFRNISYNRDSNELSSAELSSLTPLKENVKRQKADTNVLINYTNKTFFIRPEFGIGSEEIVKLAGKSGLNDTEILDSVKGTYHIPFLYKDNFKFVERYKKALFTAGINKTPIISPYYMLDASYHENRFRDYNDSEKSVSGNFTRSKDARSFILSKIIIPFSFGRFPSMNFVKDLNLSFMRSLFFYETDIPYEGEGEDSFNEKYGIKRSLFNYMELGFNPFKFHPGCFFRGRGNYAEGRDYLYHNDNEKITFPSGEAVAEYNNQLRLINNFSLNCAMEFNNLSLDTGGGMNQVNERLNINGIPRQIITVNFYTKLNVNLMKIFSFGFFRQNKPGLPYHSSNIDIGYSFNNNMIITSNIEENSHSPSLGFSFKWDRSHLGLTGGIDFRRKRTKEYISSDGSVRSKKDDIYINNMEGQGSVKEKDYGYNFSAVYETDVIWLYGLFSRIYRLSAIPIFTVEYLMTFNRYDYFSTVSPEPYDLFLLKGKIVLDLHKNIQGGITSMWALERFRNRETTAISREILSYEVGFNFTLIF